MLQTAAKVRSPITTKLMREQIKSNRFIPFHIDRIFDDHPTKDLPSDAIRNVINIVTSDIKIKRSFANGGAALYDAQLHG